MKPVASTVTEIDNLEGEEVKFTISAANTAWVMRSMADLYSNRELAVIREYSTNAYDSNKEKALRDGHDIKPIIVTLPDAMNPYFTVQDTGVGMSEAELREIYTQFGESTKRDGIDANEYNGMLGFGSKSAVAYTNTFTITAVKDGYKTVGVITRREDAMGGYLLTLKIVLNVATSEADGVTIQVPVHNWREFAHKANDFYRFWQPGTVIVNGKQPEWAVGEKIDDNLYYYEKQNYGERQSYVVMGNVPYRINNPDALFPRGMNRISFVAYVENGTVEFTPSREDLKYSDHTKRNLHKIITDFVDKAVDTAKTEIAAAKTHADAYQAWSKWRKVIGTGQVDDLSFKGDKLVDRFSLTGKRWDTSLTRYATWEIDSWQVAETNNTLIITKMPSLDNLNAGQKKKANSWKKMKGISGNFIIFTEADKVDTPWFDPSRVVEWETVKVEAPKPVRAPRPVNTAPGRLAGSFDLVSAANGRENEQDVPTTKPLYYIMVKEYNNQQDRSNFVLLLKQFDVKEKVVLLPANRKDKFLRCYPHATRIMDMLRSQVQLDGRKLISQDARDYFDIQRTDRTILSNLKVEDIKDPAVARYIGLCKKEKTEKYLEEYNKHRNLAYILGVGGQFKEHGFDRYDYNPSVEPLKDYPLAYEYNNYAYNDIAQKQNKHIVFYINALYEARKDGKNV